MARIREIALPWTQQPQEPVEGIRGLRQAWIGGLPLHGGDAWTPVNGPGDGMSQHGRIATYVAASSQYHRAPARVVTYPFTLFALVRQLQVGVNQSVIGLGGAGADRHLLYFTSGNDVAMFSGNAGGYGQAYGPYTPNTSAYRVVAGRVYGPAYRDVWIDGSVYATSSETCVVGGCDVAAVGATWQSGGPAAGLYASFDVAAAGIFDRALSDDEMRELTGQLDGYLGFLAPQRVRVPVYSAPAPVPDITFVGAESILATSGDWRVTLNYA